MLWQQAKTALPAPPTFTSQEVLQKYLADQQLLEFNHSLNLLAGVQHCLTIADIDFSADLSVLKAKAREKSDQCKEAISQGSLQTAVDLFSSYQLGDLSYSETELRHRLTDSRFWMRRIRRKTLMLICEVERALGYVCKHRAAYCGDTSVKRRQQLQQESERYLQNTSLQNEDGLSITLAEIAEHTTANPKIRRHELMVRIRGFEEVAKHCQHSAVFVTLTTPSRMHATKASGSPNEHYDGSTVQQAQNYLNHVWQLCRAKLNRDDIQPYGFRVVEPHHDGTPHWHLLLFMPAEQLPHFKNVISHYALQDSGKEKGAKKYRVKFVDIDPAKGSAAGYIAKYISKNIDGFAVGTDTSGTPSELAAQRINAWARACSIRQFQQIGGPSVTVWRELRRLKSCDDQPEELQHAYQAADSSNWAAFCLAMNAVGTPKAEQLLHPYYEVKTVEQIDYSTGEITELSLNHYGEPRSPSIAGIRYQLHTLATRLHRWRLTSVSSSAHVAADECSAGGSAPVLREAGATWTCVNNCTETFYALT